MTGDIAPDHKPDTKKFNSKALITATYETVCFFCRPGDISPAARCHRIT